MNLTVPQRQALFADIQADPAFAEVPNTPEGSALIAAAYNLLVDPAFTVWRSNVSTVEIRRILVWTEYQNLSVSNQNAFTFLCSNGIVDASNVNVREGIATIFSGPNQVGNRNGLTELGKRLATRAEKLFATGTGSTQSPATMAAEGTLSWQEVHNSRNM